VKAFVVVASLVVAGSGPVDAQMQIDQTLLAEIRAIRAVDNHCHIPAQKALPAGLSAAEPLGKTEFHYPSRLRSDNPEWRRVWHALYGLDVADTTAKSTNEVLRRKSSRMRELGDRWPGWVLDKSGIDIALVNMPQLPAAGPAGRFLLVPHANELIFPFAEGMRERLPASLDAYVDSVVRKQLQQWKKDGAVAVKFSTAYQRPLDFAVVSTEDATRIYDQHASVKKVPAAGDNKALQDHLFRVVAREAGAAGLAVHVHTGIGADPHFAIAGANPLLLESAVSDPSLRSTKFVLIHGGWPFDREAGTMLIKPNVYVDFSAHTFLRHPRSLAETLRAWLEWYPEKVLFGTDAYPEEGAPINTWEEMMWFASDSAREALAIALTGMIADGQITRRRASELASMVLRENALKLYAIGRQ
jgi:predicted TIM-barrel fold metal-dependent hydrolase